MKIAVLTWFHHHNYGTALQVSALSRVVTALGHNVDIVNYKPSGRFTAFPTNSVISDYTKKIKNRLKLYINKPYVTPKRESLFDDFYNETLSFTPECRFFSDFRDLNKSYDAFICGSDQIWAPSCYDPRYFLDFVEDQNRMIAYAPSVGLSNIKDVDIKAEIQRLVSRFRWVSTREKSGSKLIADLIKRDVNTVLDPTLLLTEQDWAEYTDNCLQKEETPYLAAYFLGKNESHWKSVYKVAKTLNLQVKIIPVFTKDFRRTGCLQTPIGPKEFLHIIKNAAFVCTDSFHGTAFAINFQKQFLTFERFKTSDVVNQNSRVYNLLDMTNLSDRLNRHGDNIDLEKVRKPIDFANAMLCLDEQRTLSKKYLCEALAGVATSVQVKGQCIGKENSICCGCTACSFVCPTGAIAIKDVNGFKTAVVEAPDKCILCGRCVKTCPFYGDSTSTRLTNGQLYSYKDSNIDILKKSSSGGAAYRIASIYLSKGYSIIGCTFDRVKQKARHIVVRPNEQDKLKLLQGSKYLQSDFSEAIDEIKNGIGPIVVFGTPCQISAAKKVAPINKEIIYVDLICHGIPSGLVYNKYQEYLARRTNMDIHQMDVSFRYKLKGWRERYIYSTNFGQSHCAHQSKDPYFRVFESCLTYAETCYDCRYRDSSDADVRLGDYWGPKFAKDKTGVSMIVSLSKTGETVVSELAEAGTLSQQDMLDYFGCQQTKNDPKPVFYNRLMKDLNSKMPIEEIVANYIYPFEKKRKFGNFVGKILNLIKKVVKK